jgi:hypothetical protein
MEKKKCYENYPAWIVLISNIVSLAIYFLGGFIIYQLGFVWLGIYLIYILFLEIKLIKNHCTICYYYGKCCAFGKGKLSAVFFRKGIKKLAQCKITWKDLILDFLVSLVPILVGIVLLIIKFNLLILFSIILLFLLNSIGNGFIRKQLACKFCKQRKIGCPAEKLFKKKK